MVSLIVSLRRTTVQLPQNYASVVSGTVHLHFVPQLSVEIQEYVFGMDNNRHYGCETRCFRKIPRYS